MPDTPDPDDALFVSNHPILKDVQFKTLSEAKLAEVLLNGLTENTPPERTFRKMLAVMQDTVFKFDEVSFKDDFDIYEYVSTARRQLATKRSCRLVPHININPDAPTTRRLPILTDALTLIVEKILEDEEPFGIAATETWWENAFKRNGATFRNMSLVHRSWTTAAQRALRRRAVVPYLHIKKFLLNPLCGPWIREMIIHWTLTDGHVSIEEEDLILLEELLRRTPNLRSLSFNTALVYRDSCIQWDRELSLHIDRCLEIMSNSLPDLEKLWLKHFDPLIPEEDREKGYPASSLTTCYELGALFRHISKLRSLTFLSLRSWGEGRSEDADLNMDIHPPASLKTVELDIYGAWIAWGEKLSSWLFKPRGDFRVKSLAVVVRKEYVTELRRYLEHCLPEVKSLTLYFQTGFWDFCKYAMALSKNLVSLDLFFTRQNVVDLSSPFPQSLERLALHLDDKKLGILFSPDSSEHAGFIEEIKVIVGLQNLRYLVITSSPMVNDEMLECWHLDAFIHHMDTSGTMAQEDIPEDLLKACQEHSVKLDCIRNAFPRHWVVPEVTREY